jgi:hypothetical protein
MGEIWKVVVLALIRPPFFPSLFFNIWPWPVESFPTLATLLALLPRWYRVEFLRGGGTDRIASIRTVTSRLHLRRQHDKIAEFPSLFPWTDSTSPEKCLFASGEILSKKLLFWNFVLDLHSFCPYSLSALRMVY